MKCYVSVVSNHEDEYLEFDCFETKDKARDYLVEQLREHYTTKCEFNTDYLNEDELENIIQEMTEALVEDGIFVDERDNTEYFVERKNIN
jgi:hypothetical protein